jgi:phosphatidylserine/phosphatidylglycerophosphate/cardiolipin synthase-like enzyme
MPNPRNDITVITDDGVASCILDILRNAKEGVSLISPYLNMRGHLKDQIMSALDRGIELRVLIRPTDQKHFQRQEEQDIGWLIENGALVYLAEWLHAKIYLNEEYGVVSSMNLTEVSPKNSKDIALVIHDEEVLHPIREYSYRLFKSAILLTHQSGETHYHQPKNWTDPHPTDNKSLFGED